MTPEFASNSSSSISAAALNTRVPKYQGHGCRRKEDGADSQIRSWGGSHRQGEGGNAGILRKRGNFNSAAVATNQNPLINGDVREQ